MAPVVVRYPLDPTGLSPDNLVQGEEHTLGTRRTRAFATHYGGFFTESIVIRDKVTTQILQKNVDYYCAELYEVPTARYGKEICSVVVIVNESVSSQIIVDYQTLGGPWGTSQQAIIQMFDRVNVDDRPVKWGDIINKPTEFNPAHHLHDQGDIYGFEYTVAELERIYQAILMGDRASHDEIYLYIDNELHKHLTDYNNPHKVHVHQTGGYTREEIDDMFDNHVSAVVLALTVSGPTQTASGYAFQLTANAETYLLGQTLTRFEFILPNGTIIDGTPNQGGVGVKASRVNITLTGSIGDEQTIKVIAYDNLGNRSNSVDHRMTFVNRIPINMTNLSHNIPKLMLHNTTISDVRFTGITSPTSNPLKIQLTKSGITENIYTPNININVGANVQMRTPVQSMFSRILNTTITATDGGLAFGEVTTQTEVVMQTEWIFPGPDNTNQTSTNFTFPATGRYKVIVTGGGGNNAGGGGGTAVSIIDAIQGEVASLISGGRTRSSSFNYKTYSLIGNNGANGLGGAGGVASGGQFNYNGTDGTSTPTEGGYYEQVYETVGSSPCQCCLPDIKNKWCNIVVAGNMGWPEPGKVQIGTGTSGSYTGCPIYKVTKSKGSCTMPSGDYKGQPGYLTQEEHHRTYNKKIYGWVDVWVPVTYPPSGGESGKGPETIDYPYDNIGNGGDESENGFPGGIKIEYLGSLT